jgi:hypothetical protein
LKKEEADLNKFIVPMLLAIIFSIILTPSLVNAEIKVTPPLNWQSQPDNNATSMVWAQNSTKSVFGIIQPQLHTKSPFVSFLFPFINDFLAQFLAEKGLLESTDKTSFGKTNYGYRYFIDLSSLPKLLNSSNTSVSKNTIPGLFNSDHDFPFKMMVILSQKQGDLYGVFFLSPRQNFESTLNELKPVIDSIELSNSTALSN